MKCLTHIVPPGWRFYTADGSILGQVYVMLCRDEDQRARWLRLPEPEQAQTFMYLTGKGDTLAEALADAVAHAAEIPLLGGK